MISPVHFAERHTLFVIISLGEALVAIGATASDVGLSLTVFVGLVGGTAVACVVWWVYFAFIPDVAEHTLDKRRGPRNAVSWRAICSRSDTSRS